MLVRAEKKGNSLTLAVKKYLLQMEWKSAVFITFIYLFIFLFVVSAINLEFAGEID